MHAPSLVNRPTCMQKNELSCRHDTVHVPRRDVLPQPTHNQRQLSPATRFRCQTSTMHVHQEAHAAVQNRNTHPSRDGRVESTGAEAVETEASPAALPA